MTVMMIVNASGGFTKLKRTWSEPSAGMASIADRRRQDVMNWRRRASVAIIMTRTGTREIG